MQSVNLRRKRLQRIVIPFAVLVVLLFAVRLALTLTERATSPEADMASYFDGTERLRAGLPLYRPNINIQQQNFQFIYPPPLALMLLPFPTYAAAWWGWATISIACWLGALGLLLRELGGVIRTRLDSLWWPLLIAALINFPPVQSHLFWGQLQLPLLLLLTASWLSLRRGQDVRAGIFLGLAIALKLFPALLILFLLIQRRWRCVMAASVTATAVLGVSFVLVGLDQAYYYFSTVLPEIEHSLAQTTVTTTSIGAVFRGAFGDPILASWVSLVIRSLVVVLAAIGSARLHNAPDRAFALGMTTLVLAPPVVWEHYFVLLYLPWLELLARAPQRRLALAYFLIATASLAYHMPPGFGFVGHLLPISGALLLWGFQLKSIFSGFVPPIHSREAPESAPS